MLGKLRLLEPAGLAVASNYFLRFRELGYYPHEALRNVFSAASRKALAVSGLDLFPSFFFRDIDTVVDVGANDGVWSQAVQALLNPRSMFAFEPAPETFNRLESRFSDQSSVKLFNCALGAQEGDAKLYEFETTQLNSLLAPAKGMEHVYGSDPVRRETLVKVVTLDAALGAEKVESVDLLKIDVQGSELRVLHGARETLSMTKAVLLEYLFMPHYEGQAEFCQLHQFMVVEANFILYNLGHLAAAADGRLAWGDAAYIRQDTKAPISSQ